MPVRRPLHKDARTSTIIGQEALRLFTPILAGATSRDRILSCIGAVIGIGITAFVCHRLSAAGVFTPFLVAPMGASAVLLFAVPASPLAQPWAIIGGNSLSALTGIIVFRLVPDPVIAGALAVGLAIGVMSLCRCLHPPGGAAALTAVLGGPAVAASGIAFAFAPVALNSILLVLAGLLFHRFSGHSYPHVAAPVGGQKVPAPLPVQPSAFTRADIDMALADYGEALDVSRDDLDLLLHYAEAHAMERHAPAIGPDQVK